MKYLSRTLIAFFSIIMSLNFLSCENLMFIDAAQLYRVSFETNGGTEIEAYRTDIIAKVPDCKKEDAEFLGWYTSSDFYSDKITFPYELKEDTTLYAKWVQKYQVLFETNGGSEIAGYKTSVVKDAPITLKNENIFMGWYTTPDFSGEAAVFPYTLTEPTVFYAKWGQIFTVQFETNGGTAVADLRVASILECPESSKEGYVLSGWYLDIKLTKPISFPYKFEDIYIQKKDNISPYASGLLFPFVYVRLDFPLIPPLKHLQLCGLVRCIQTRFSHAKPPGAYRPIY